MSDDAASALFLCIRECSEALLTDLCTQRFLRLNIRGQDHILYPFAEMPAFDYFITLFFFCDYDIAKPDLFEHLFQFLHGNRAGDSAGVGFFILLYRFGEFTLLQDIRDCKSPSQL